MTPFDYILFALVLSAVAVVIALALTFTKEDCDAAGVHIDDHNSLDLSKVYAEPMGFEPHGVRDPFPLDEVDAMSTDEFIEALRHSVVDGVWLGNYRMHQQVRRAAGMLVHAREIMDECLDGLPSDIGNEELVNKVSNWLVRGHQD